MAQRTMVVVVVVNVEVLRLDRKSASQRKTKMRKTCNVYHSNHPI
jgi:hypothetical protein